MQFIIGIYLPQVWAYQFLHILKMVNVFLFCYQGNYQDIQDFFIWGIFVCLFSLFLVKKQILKWISSENFLWYFSILTGNTHFLFTPDNLREQKSAHFQLPDVTILLYLYLFYVLKNKTKSHENIIKCMSFYSLLLHLTKNYEYVSHMYVFSTMCFLVADFHFVEKL